MMRHFRKSQLRDRSGIQTPCKADEEHHYQNDSLGMAFRSGKVNNPIDFVKTLKKDLDNSKFNNTPESHL